MAEVLISPADALAFQQFVAAAREGRFAASFDEPMPAVESYVVTDLIVPPITIEPLDSPAANN